MRKIARKIFSRRHATATFLLIALSLSILTPTLVQFSTPAEPFQTAMHKDEDIFEGKFSPQHVSVAPNQVADVSFSISPTMDVPDTVIQFFMPTDFIKLVKGEPVWTGSVKKGETMTIQLSIMAEEEVDMGVRAYVEASPEGKAYSSSYYLPVTSMSPENAGKNEVPLIQLGPPDTQVAPTPQDPGTITIKGTLWYVNEWGTWSRMRYVLVELWDDDWPIDEYCTYTWTGGDGFFSITWNNNDGLFQDGRDPYFKVFSEGKWDWVTKDGGSRYSAQSWKAGNDVPNGFVYDYGNVAPSANNEAWEAGDAVFGEADWIWARVFWSRYSKVEIIWPKEDWPHCHGDSIHLPAKSTAWWGHVTVHHEYAHSVMWDLYGNNWPPGTQGGTHWVYMEDVLPDAYVEGWAEFMECAVDNNPNNLQSVGHNIEKNDWYNHQDTGSMDGAYVEGEVASIFWDILDPTGTESGWDRFVTAVTWTDSMAWGFDEIFWIIHDHYSSIANIEHFWTQWVAHYPTLSTSVGPLCTIYWNYGIDHDTYAPYDGTIIINAGATYTTSRTVTLTLSCKDWGSGVKQMRFSNDVGATWSAWVPYATTYSYYMTNPGDGTKDVDVQFKDYNGYTTTALTIWDSIILDTTAPTGSIIINSGNPTYTTTTSVTLYLTYSDATSGVDQVRYQNAGQAWTAWMAPSATKAWTLTTGDGTKTVYYQVKDKAGLLSVTYSDTIILDTVPPVTTISHSPGSSTVSLSATDATSGVAATYYRIDLGSWITYIGPFTLTGTGTHTIDYYSQDKAGLIEWPPKTLKVHYLTVNTEPAGITTISGTGWYDHGTTATTGAAPTTVTSGGIVYTFSTWKKDGTPVAGNPISVLMDAPHTATAAYITATIKIWTDKTTYKIGETMKVYVRVKNPGAALPVRALIWLKLPSGALYGPLLNMTTTLPANWDSGDILWQTFTIPSAPLGDYAWIAELRNPTTGALINQSTWNWKLSAAATTETPSTKVILQAKP